MSSLLLVQVIHPEHAAWTSELSTYFAVVPVILPVVQRMYDAIIVPIIKVLKNQGCNPIALFFAMIGFLASLPGMIVKLVGLEAEDARQAKMTAGAADKVNKMSIKTNNENVTKLIENEVGQLAQKLWWFNSDHKPKEGDKTTPKQKEAMKEGEAPATKEEARSMRGVAAFKRHSTLKKLTEGIETSKTSMEPVTSTSSACVVVATNTSSSMRDAASSSSTPEAPTPEVGSPSAEAPTRSGSTYGTSSQPTDRPGFAWLRNAELNGNMIEFRHHFPLSDSSSDATPPASNAGSFPNRQPSEQAMQSSQVSNIVTTSDGTTTHLMGTKGNEFIVRTEMQGGQVLHYSGAKGEERVLRITFPDGLVEQYDGVKGEEYKVSAEFPDGKRQLYEGSMGKERKVSVELPSGDISYYQGEKGQEHLVRTVLSNGKVLHLRGKQGDERVVRVDLPHGVTQYYKGEAGEEYLVSAARTARTRAVPSLALDSFGD